MVVEQTSEFISSVIDDTYDIAVPTTKATIKAAIVGFIPLLELAVLAALTVAIIKAPAKLLGLEE